MVALITWLTLPGGGVYAWAWLPAAAAALILTIAVRPRIARTAGLRTIDMALILAIAVVAVQLVPLPVAVLQAIDPHAQTLRRALSSVVSSTGGDTGLSPISVLSAETLQALGIFSMAVLVYWTCRQICAIGGTGRMVRGIAILGLLASVVAIVQHGPKQELLYNYWRPRDPGARPYGPFVNRNHFATWLIMACPLVFGYLLARAPTSNKPRTLSQRIVRAATEIGSFRVWLAAAVCVMTVAVVLSASRSGVIGLVAALAAFAWFSRTSRAEHTRGWLLVQGAMLVVVVLSFANFSALSGRIDETVAENREGVGRSAIWRDAGRVAADFRWTGTGAGTFGAAIVPYQTAAIGYAIGQAHNHYVQVAAEGGVLLVVPALLVGASFLQLCRRRLRDDASASSLIRAGAVAGIAGVFVQSLWETGLRMPGNAILFAVLAAVATYPSSAGRTPTTPPEGTV